ncbi:MAG: hypothetical protein RI932_1133, partial [Pseudomonadota bacterium]
GDIEGLLTGITERTQDPVEQLRQLIRVCFDIVRQKREYYCINMDFWTQINQKEKVRLAVAKHYGKFRGSTAAIVQAGVDSGVFKPIDADHAASVIIAIVDGISLQWLFDESSFPYDDLIKTSEEIVFRFLLK